MSSQFKNFKRFTRRLLDEALDTACRGFREDRESPRALDLTQLEQRVLMSASPVSAVAEAVDLAVEAAIEPQTPTNSATVDRDSQNAQTESEIQVTVELVVIDPSAENHEQLVADLQSQTDRTFEILVLNPREDGIAQITDALKELRGVSAIHLVSHGDEGEILLGTSVLSQRNIGRYAAELVTWQHSLTTDADLLIYGCDLAANAEGIGLTESLNVLLGTDVAASDDGTGHAMYGGNWNLEYSVGTIEADIAFTEELQKNWEGKLAVITVTTTADETTANGQTSLREAIIQANASGGGDTIMLGAGTYTLALTGTGENASATGDLDILSSVTIIGAGADLTFIDGGGIDRVFNVHNDSTIANLSGLTIRNGAANHNSAGIYIEDESTLNLSDAVLMNNIGNATAGGGAGGAVHVHGTFNANRVLFTGNVAESGGAIYFHNAVGGTLTNVTISGNTADASGGGIYTEDAITIVNSTITQNIAGSGGGIRTQTAMGEVDIQNTIVAGNTSTSAIPDLQGNYTSSGNNLIGDGTGQNGLSNGTNGDHVGTRASPINPLLGALANNGGPIMTHAPLTGSTALNGGTAVGAPSTDARGLSSADGRIDIGAVQSGAAALNRLYWSDSIAKQIQSSHLDGSNVVDVVTGMNAVDELFVDSVNGKIYWSESAAGVIRSVNLDGTGQTNVLTGLTSPQGIAVDIANQKIYWAEDALTTNRIRRANLDGSGVESVASTGLTSPDSVSLDLQNGKIYWSDEFSNEIERANLDGSGRETVINTDNYALSVTVDPYSNRIFWTNFDVFFGGDKIYSATLENWTPTELVHSAGSTPDNLVVDAVNGKLYWTDGIAKTISQSNLDGTDVTVLPVGTLQLPKGIAIGASPAATVNSAPTANASGPYAINEGDSLNLVGSASTDPDADPLTYEWDLNYNGTFAADISGTDDTPQASWAALQAAGIVDNGSYAVALRVSDGNGGSNVSTTTLTVNNAAPTLSTTGTGTAIAGSAYTLNLSGTDLGADTITSWTINWGDGTIETIAGNPSSVTHTFTAVQTGFTFNILASATDEDGTHFQNQLLVASSQNDRVMRYATDGSFEQQFAIGDGTDYPVDLIIGPDGNMYLSGWESDNVLRYNSGTGEFIDAFVPAGTGGLDSAAGLAFGPDGNFYVASRLTSEVLRFNGATGAFIDAFVTAGSGGLNDAEGLTFGPDGNLYVSDYQDDKVYKYDGTTGAFLTEFVTAGSGGLNFAEDLTFGPDNNLYVADNNSVLRYNGTTGAFIDAFVSSASGGLNFASGLAFGPDGNLYVGSWNTNSVLRYNGTTGAFIDMYISNGLGGLSKTDYLNFLPEHQVTVSAAPNTAPTANAGGPYAINEGNSLVLNASGSSDPETDTLTYTWDLDNDGQFDDATGATPSIAFASLPAAIRDDGTYSISVRADDGNGGSDDATTTLTITNVAPTGNADSGVAFTTDEDTTFTTGDATANDTDPADASDPLTVTNVDTTGTTGLVTINADGKSFDYDPDGKFESLANGGSATDTFTYTVSDSDGGTTSSILVAVTINGVNDRPTNITIDNHVIEEDSSSAAIDFAVNDIDNAAGTLTVTAESSDQAIVANSDIVITGTGSNRTVQWTPRANAHGSITITLTVSDGLASSQSTFDVVVQPVNDAPQLSPTVTHNYASAGIEGVRLTVAELLAGVTDVENDRLTIIASQPANGSVVVNTDGAFAYKPKVGYSGTDLFRFVVSDGVSVSRESVVRIEVPISVSAPTQQPQASAESSASPESLATVETKTSGDANAKTGSVATLDVAPAPYDASDDDEKKDVPPPTSQSDDEDTASELLTVELAASNQEFLFRQDVVASTNEMERVRTQALRSMEQLSVTEKSDEDTTLADPLESTRTSLQFSYERFTELKGTVDQIDEFQEHLNAAHGITAMAEEVLVVGATSIVVGSIITAVQSGMLALGFLSQLPAWTLFDPLMVMDGVNGGDDGDSLQDIVDRQDQEESTRKT